MAMAAGSSSIHAQCVCNQSPCSQNQPKWFFNTVLLHHQKKIPLPSLSLHLLGSHCARTRVYSSLHEQIPSSPRVPAQVAHELLNAGHLFLDVRTPEEFAAGHIEGAINIPYMYKAGSGLAKNLKFLDIVAERLARDDEIVVGCQTGKRSQMAVAELVAAGFTGVTDMAGGYLAWVRSGMPTRQVV